MSGGGEGGQHSYSPQAQEQKHLQLLIALNLTHALLFCCDEGCSPVAFHTEGSAALRTWTFTGGPCCLAKTGVHPMKYALSLYEACAYVQSTRCVLQMGRYAMS